MIAYLLIALAMVSLLVTEAAGQTLSGGSASGASFGSSSGGGSPPGTLFNDATLNIFDTYDPLCDPATAAANGIVFCDGFEDGAAGGGNNVSATTDYWGLRSDNGSGCTGCNATSTAEDLDDAADGPFTPYSTATATNQDWSICNTGTIDTGKANFAGAGTPCAMTTGWGRDFTPIHCLKPVSGDPSHCATAGTSGQMNHVYVRFMLKMVGQTSERCPAGFGSCGALSLATFGGNGAKLVELNQTLDIGGIAYMDWSFQAGQTSPMFGFGADDGERCGAATNTGKSGFDGFYLQQNQGNNFNWNTAWDHWVNVEFMIKYDPADDSSAVKMWVDDCGADGKQCTDTPTLRFSMTNLDMQADADCVVPRSLWLNGWAFDHSSIEYNWDEIVVRDGSILDEPIGFHTSCLGGGC